MKKLGFLFFGFLAAALQAAPTTQVTVTHPTTTAVKNLPRTNVVVSKPTTTAVVTRPVTTAPVTRPTTPGVSSSAALKTSSGLAGSSSKGGSYTPSYKNAKTLAPSAADTPKAAKLGSGTAGLGMTDPNAAQKAAEAASSTKPKAETSQPSLDDVLKKTKLPGDISSKLKQRNFEAAKAAGK